MSAEQNTKTRRVIARLVFVFCSALTVSRCSDFQSIPNINFPDLIRNSMQNEMFVFVKIVY